MVWRTRPGPRVPSLGRCIRGRRLGRILLGLELALFLLLALHFLFFLFLPCQFFLALFKLKIGFCQCVILSSKLVKPASGRSHSKCPSLYGWSQDLLSSSCQAVPRRLLRLYQHFTMQSEF